MIESRIRTIYRLEGGVLDGTEIEPVQAFLTVKYPHRKTKDLYVPPMKANNGEVKTWHCCQDNCPNPDFEGGLDALIDHLLLHKGRLLKSWSKKQQLKSPLPAVKIPANPYDRYPQQGANMDRQFCVKLYREGVIRSLQRQGLAVMAGEGNGTE